MHSPLFMTMALFVLNKIFETLASLTKPLSRCRSLICRGIYVDEYTGVACHVDKLRKNLYFCWNFMCGANSGRITPSEDGGPRCTAYEAELIYYS